MQRENNKRMGTKVIQFYLYIFLIHHKKQYAEFVFPVNFPASKHSKPY